MAKIQIVFELTETDEKTSVEIKAMEDGKESDFGAVPNKDCFATAMAQTASMMTRFYLQEQGYDPDDIENEDEDND